MLVVSFVLACASETRVPLSPPEETSVTGLRSLAPSIHFSRVATGIGNGGNLQVILLGASDGLPYLLYQVSGSGSWYWRGALPNPSGLQFSGLATGKATNGNLQVILLHKGDGIPYLIWQQQTDGSWHWYGPLPDPQHIGFVNLATASNNVIVFGTGAINGLPYTINLAGTTWSWGGQLPDPNGVRLGALAVASCDPVECPYVRQLIGLGSADGLPYLVAWLQGGTWNWLGPMPDPGVALITMAAGNGGPNQNPQVIGLGASDGRPYLFYQTNPSGTWYWSGQLPNPNGLAFTTVATGVGNNDNLQVILLHAGDGLPYVVYQVDESGSWYWGGQLPDPNGIGFGNVATGIGNGGNLQVVMLGASDGLPYLLYQVHGSGSWYWAGRLPTP
jgi:hypothetical protein